MPVTRTLAAHGCVIAAGVLVAVGAACAAPSPDTIVPAVSAALTAVSGALLALRLTQAAAVASAMIPVVPVALKLEAAVAPLVAAEWHRLHEAHPAAVLKPVETPKVTP